MLCLREHRELQRVQLLFVSNFLDYDLLRRFEFTHEIEFSLVLSRIVKELRIGIRLSGCDADEIRKLVTDEMLNLSRHLEISNLLSNDFKLDSIKGLHVSYVPLLAVFCYFSEISLGLLFELCSCLKHDFQVEWWFLLILLPTRL